MLVLGIILGAGTIAYMASDRSNMLLWFAWLIGPSFGVHVLVKGYFLAKKTFREIDQERAGPVT